jgi:molybdate transport system substrate-binding protein
VSPYNAPMTRRTLLAIAAVLGGHLCLASARPAAQSPTRSDALRVLSSNGMKGSMEALQPECENAIGRPLAIDFGSTASLKKRIETGEPFDVTIITIDAIADLVRQGKLTAASRADVGRSELGIGIRAGAARPDIRTTAALAKALRSAPSITYPQDGASRGTIEKMFERMGITADLKPKIILAPGSTAATESVAAGKAAMVITLFSEIVPTHGVEILGALPGEYQSDIRFAAATSSASKHADVATTLIAFLSGPKAAPVLKAKGIEPR